MPKPKKGARLGGSASHQKKILANLAKQLFEHGQIKTTDTKAKLLRPYAEKLITKAKGGTLADRRNAAKLLNDNYVVQHLFDELAPKFANREGGYTRIIKLGNRKGRQRPHLADRPGHRGDRFRRGHRATRAAASRSRGGRAGRADRGGGPRGRGRRGHRRRGRGRGQGRRRRRRRRG